MLLAPLLIVYLSSGAAPSADVQVEVTEPGAELQVRLDAGNWSQTCPVVVTSTNPCRLTGVPVDIVHVTTSGSTSIDTRVLLRTSPSVLRIEHIGYGRSLVGLALVAAAVGVLAAGLRTGPDGRSGIDQGYLTVGAATESVGILLLLSDLMRRHDRAIVVD